MHISAYRPAKAPDDINKLIVSGEIQHNNRYIGCCERYYLLFPNDQHKYVCNPVINQFQIL